MTLALTGYVVTGALPLVNAGAATADSGTVRELAGSLGPGRLDVTSVGAMLGQIRDLDLTANSLTVTTADGQTMSAAFDTAQIAKSITQPSGNEANDALKSLYR